MQELTKTQQVILSYLCEKYFENVKKAVPNQNPRNLPNIEKVAADFAGEYSFLEVEQAVMSLAGQSKGYLEPLFADNTLFMVIITDKSIIWYEETQNKNIGSDVGQARFFENAYIDGNPIININHSSHGDAHQEISTTNNIEDSARYNFVEDKEIKTPITTRVVGVVDFLSGLSTIIPFAMSLFTVIKSDDKTLAILSLDTSILYWFMGSLFFTLFFFTLWKIMKNPMYLSAAFGRVIAVKEDKEKNTNRITLVKISKSCPDCQELGKKSLMMPKNKVTESHKEYYTDGKIKTIIDKKELFLVCKKYPSKHYLRIDTTSA